MKSNRSFSEVNVIFEGGYTKKFKNIMFICELSKCRDYFYFIFLLWKTIARSDAGFLLNLKSKNETLRPLRLQIFPLNVERHHHTKDSINIEHSHVNLLKIMQWRRNKEEILILTRSFKHVTWCLCTVDIIGMTIRCQLEQEIWEILMGWNQ